MEINIAKDYTETPGGRYISEGKYSGEDFRKKILLPKYDEAVKKGEKLVVNMDGCYGFAPSFLDESFGGLAREKKDKSILSNIIIISNDEPGILNRIKKSVEKM